MRLTDRTSIGAPLQPCATTLKCPNTRMQEFPAFCANKVFNQVMLDALFFVIMGLHLTTLDGPHGTPRRVEPGRACATVPRYQHGQSFQPGEY